MSFAIFRQSERGGDRIAVQMELSRVIYAVIVCCINVYLQYGIVDVDCIAEMRPVDDWIQTDHVLLDFQAAHFIQGQCQPGGRAGKDRTDVLTCFRVVVLGTETRIALKNKRVIHGLKRQGLVDHEEGQVSESFRQSRIADGLGSLQRSDCCHHGSGLEDTPVFPVAREIE